ncbi:MAG: DHH family phosphoesterase [Odoribacter sp.]
MRRIEDEIDKLKLRLSQADLRVVIIPHISPDGDAVGSCSALYEVFRLLGIQCHLLTCDYIPDYLRFLKNIHKVISYLDKPEECKQIIAEADLIFMLDHNTVKREGELESFVSASPAERVIIDHHPGPDEQEFVISNTEVSSTCELLYSIIVRIWGKEVINPDVANALYTGINTDTGGLSHNSSHPETYRIIADLLEQGLDKGYIHERIYQMNNLSRLRLIGNVLLNKLQVSHRFPLAIMPITQEELDRYNYKDGDLEGLVNIPLSVHNICVSIQITERKERVKLSFRSKGNIAVNEWAKAFFNGGGHQNAAGGQMDLPLEEVVRKVNETAPWFFEQLKTK